MKNDYAMTPSLLRNRMATEIRKLGEKYGDGQVFSDFLEMSAIAFSNQVDMAQYEERERQYLRIVERYSREEMNVFPKLLADLIMAINLCMESPEDILGPLFHELEPRDNAHRQLFSPPAICDLMGEIALHDSGLMQQEKEYMTVCEPTVGSGAMILGMVKASRRNMGLSRPRLIFEGTDKDIKCVHMAYLQLSLYEIPAAVIHGDSLSNEKWSYWFTPTFAIDDCWTKLYNT